MDACSCGCPIDDGDALCARCAALRVFDLGPDATDSSIRTAYRLLIKVWHPDRFQNDEKLKQAAEEKLKEMNSAYEYLISGKAGRSTGRKPRAAAADSGASRTAKAPAAARPVPAAQRRQGFRWRAAIRVAGKLAIAGVVILLGRYAWIAFNVHETADQTMGKVYQYGTNSVLPGLEGPRQRFLAAVEEDLARLGIRRRGSALPATVETSGAEAKTQVRQGQHTAGSRSSREPGAGSPAIEPYITIGLTKDEVVAAAGEPTTAASDKLVYGKSEIDMKDGKVSGWKIDSTAPLRVKLWPDGPVDTSLDTFTVGSTKNEVLVVQGTPTAFTADHFSYGRSEVYFQNDRVVSWKNDPSSNPLHVQAQ